MSPTEARLLTRGGRMFSLDVLRGLAILLVLLLHFPPSELRSNGPANELVTWIGSVGWIGVDLFFVLSGFLISGLIYDEYERSGRFDAFRFLLRRGFKIWPAYFAAYGGMTLMRIGAEHWKGNPDRAADLAASALCNGLFLQNYLDCERWSHSWSLAVEEHFYTVLAILFGWLAWHGMKRGRAASEVFAVVLPLAAATALIALCLRIAECFPVYLYDGGRAYYQSHMRADSLLCGVALSFVLRYRTWSFISTVSRWPYVVLALCAAVLWPTLFPNGRSPWSESVSLSLIYLSFAVVVSSAALNPDFGVKQMKIVAVPLRGLAWLGVYSYTIYLAHSVLFGIPGLESARQALLRLLLGVFSEPEVMWIDRVLFLSFSISIGVLLSLAVERPFLRIRERWLITRPGPSSPAHAATGV